MIRLLLIAIATFGVTAAVLADPVKKVAVVVSDKLTKECAESFIKALLDGKVDEALKLCATPFREQDGTKSETLDNLKKEFGRPPPAGIEIKVGESIALDKFNEWSKKNGDKEMSDDAIKEYGEFLGKDGRIVMLEVKMMGQAIPKGDRPHMLIRVKDGKAQIVGVGGR